jgi:hypothetical protein
VTVQGDINSDSDMELKEEVTLWQAENNSCKIMRHIYSDTGSAVEPHTGLKSDSQPVEIFLKFVRSGLVYLIVDETVSYQQNMKDKHIS